MLEIAIIQANLLFATGFMRANNMNLRRGEQLKLSRGLRLGYECQLRDSMG